MTPNPRVSKPFASDMSSRAVRLVHQTGPPGSVMHIRKREGAYHWRRKVPLTLARRWGRRELIRSLRTSDRRAAHRNARTLYVDDRVAASENLYLTFCSA